MTRCLLLFAALCGLFCAGPTLADDDIETAASLLEILIDVDPDSARSTLATLSEKVQTGELGEKQTAALKERLGKPLTAILAKEDHPLAFDAALLAATWQEEAALRVMRQVATSASESVERRSQAFAALAATNDKQAIPLAEKLLTDTKAPLPLRSSLMGSLGKYDSPQVADVILARYANYEGELQPKAIELLTQRPAWSKQLVAAIGDGKVPASALNANQVAKLLASPDEDLKELVKARWGTVRTERNPEREKVVAEMRSYLRHNRGDAAKGAAVFQKVCGQCHKIYGQGQEVGPEITANGRGNFEQLLSNVFDPSLVIGAAYQARQVVTDEGRVLAGLLAEENDQRVILKTQGGKIETIPRDEVDEINVSPLSLMPEGLENQLKPEELADLFAFLVLDRPPSDPDARYISGTPVDTGEKWKTVLAKFAPGWSAHDVGEGEAVILPEHRGRKHVLQTHPLDKATGSVLRRSVSIPEGKKTTLTATVSHHEQSDWQLVVRVGSKRLHEQVVGPEATKNGWMTVDIDLSDFAGQTVPIELLNVPTGWNYEFAYWGEIKIESK